MATVIPVKVLNQNGSGWSSVIARGIIYMADLKAGPLAGYPVVINMSLGGPALDPMEKAAIDYAIAGRDHRRLRRQRGRGRHGLSGRVRAGDLGRGVRLGRRVDRLADRTWWYAWMWLIRPIRPTSTSPTSPAARWPARTWTWPPPARWVVGPYQVNSGQTSYYFLGGTTMASPHVAGIVALMAQKNPGLQQSDVETILESSAIPLPAGSRQIVNLNRTGAMTRRTRVGGRCIGRGAGHGRSERCR